MLVLARRKPHKLEVCEALMRRGILPESNREALEDFYLRQSIGYDGECIADNYWKDLRLNIPYVLLHSFETTHRNMFHHQIDTLFVCKHFLLIVELKYIAGELSYNIEFNQFWRNHGGQQLTLGDPFAQLSRHELLMSHYLMEIGLDIPIITAVIVTAKSAFLNEMPNHFHIFKIEGLGLKLKSWLEKFPEVISNEEVIRISSFLMSRFNPRRWDWKRVFPNITYQKGVLCSSCNKRMDYMNGRFICKCGNKLKSAMYEALNDYRILSNEWISNRELREYLGIVSPNTANKILKKVSGAYIGDNRGRKYLLSKDILTNKIKKFK